MKQILPARILFAPMVLSWAFLLFTSFMGLYAICEDFWDSMGWASLIAFLVGYPLGIAVTPIFLQYSGADITYNSTVQAVQEPQVLVIQFYTSETEAEYIDCGLSNTEWRIMAENVHSSKKFTVDVLMRAFEQAGETKQRGRDIYSTSGETLKRVMILKEYKTGYILTELGEYFFMRLATLPYPYVTRPDILKLLGQKVSTEIDSISEITRPLPRQL